MKSLDLRDPASEAQVARQRLSRAEWRARSARMALWSLPIEASQAQRTCLQNEADAANNLHAIAVAEVARLNGPLPQVAA